MLLRVIDIVAGTSVDGPHLRTSIYLAGCAHHCPGCHNPQSWDPHAGHEIAVSDLLDVIAREEMPVTLSGGDPLFQAEGIAALTRLLKDRHKTSSPPCRAWPWPGPTGRRWGEDPRGVGEADIWLYTGYRWEQIVATPRLLDAVSNVDVVVDGPFVQSLRDTTLLFRGSSNQRIIDVAASLASGTAIPLSLD
ncbi:MAG: 4Fe-4S cluster-binding domain-containing protein [Muribaculaceae bacterium]|nr:4Fe-4S cluster-binding domain-containing protein [Muribaculaceae bacterium]